MEERDPASPPPLDYRPPSADAQGKPRTPFAGQMAIGFAAAVLAVPLALFVGVFLSESFGRRGTGESIMLGTCLLVAVALVGVTILAWVRWKWRGFAAGVGLAVGLLGLAVGLCFAAFIFDLG